MSSRTTAVNCVKQPLLVVTLAAALCCLLCSSAAAQLKAGDVRTTTITIGSKSIALRFRFCPGGTLIPGRPGTKTSPVEMSPFYILESEVTVGNVGAVLGDDRLQAIQKRAGADLQSVAADPSLPAFALHFDDVRDFCMAVEEAADDAPITDRSPLERWQVRIPSHFEWQYACRAATTAEEAASRPHYHSWAKLDDLGNTLAEKGREEWQRIGGKGAFTGTQAQVAELLEKGTANNNLQPVEVLSAYFKQALGVERSLAEVAVPPKLLTPRQAKGNLWNIVNMHENVREWVLVARTQAEAGSTWRRLTDPNERSRLDKTPLFFFAGGSFQDTATRATGWTRFTSWGGFSSKIDQDSVGLAAATGDIVAVSQDDLADGDILDSEMPGLRLVLQREMRPDWLAAVRQAVTQADLAEVRNVAQACRQTLRELKVENGPEIESALRFYEALSVYRSGDAADAAARLSELQASSPALGTDAYFTELTRVLGAKPSGSRPVEF